MKIQNHEITIKKKSIEIDIEINCIQWSNDSIGWYEFGSQRLYDHQPDYVEDFEIDEILINNKIITNKFVLQVLSNILMDDKELFKKIEQLLKKEADEEKADRAREARNDIRC